MSDQLSIRPGLLLIPCAFLCGALSLTAAGLNIPTAKDPQLEVTLFASEPGIVTPIGIAIDRRNRIFVLESHTHEAKADYPGPKHDRVKMFIDRDGDGKPDAMSIFAGELRHAMNLAFSPGQELYLSHRSGLLILHDRDGDGVSESRTPIVRLETAETYPHNGLDGLAFSPDGWLYFGLGENLGRSYTVKGTDGSQYSGGGEGGNVFRCRPDGSHVQLIATGFWNPFSLEFDHLGRLFCVDNDPDGRPPCRLLHVVTGGDYGYKFRYGRSGLHPFIAWEGELPGTLPMIAGTGEAPSGTLEGRKARLPAEYADSLLVTAWGDCRIERYRLKPAGASFRAEKEIVIQGNSSFRPVGIAAGADGAVYITDWADTSYPVHQKGRIWRVSARSATTASESRRPNQASISAAEARMHRLLDAESPVQEGELFDAMIEADPFLRAAAIHSLAKPAFRSGVVARLDHEDARVRLGALLALRRANHEEAVPILEKRLADPDDQVRLMAVIWIGEKVLTPLMTQLDGALSSGSVTPRLFQAYLATVEILNTANSKAPKPQRSVWDQGPSGAQLIKGILRDESKPVNLRSLALTMLPDPDDDEVTALLGNLVKHREIRLRTEAVRTLADSLEPKAIELLEGVAFDRKAPAELRAEAILGLAGRPVEIVRGLTNLLHEAEAAVQLEAARAFRVHADDPSIRAALERRLGALEAQPATAALRESIELALALAGAPVTRPVGERPASAEEWLAAAAMPGDASAGRRVFFHNIVTCVRCHRVDGRGGSSGPDLSGIARIADRRKMVESILDPSRDIAPQFVQYDVETKGGEIYSGVLAGRADDGTVTLILGDGRKELIAGSEIVFSKPSEISSMPDGLEEALTVQEFRDLLAFLLSLK